MHRQARAEKQRQRGVDKGHAKRRARVRRRLRGGFARCGGAIKRRVKGNGSAPRHRLARCLLARHPSIPRCAAPGGEEVLPKQARHKARPALAAAQQRRQRPRKQARRIERRHVGRSTTRAAGCGHHQAHSIVKEEGEGAGVGSGELAQVAGVQRGKEGGGGNVQLRGQQAVAGSGPSGILGRSQQSSNRRVNVDGGGGGSADAHCALSRLCAPPPPPAET